MRLFNKQFMVANLCFMHGIIVASVPMLRFAVKRASGALAEYYKRHIDQERGHDAMLRDDLLRLGVKNIPKYHSAAQIAGAQYYLIAHESPALLLGYMLCLESNSLPEELIVKLQNLHGSQLNCMMHHAAHDQQHAVELRKQIAKQSPEMQDRIAWNSTCTMHSLLETMDAIWNDVEKQEALSA